MSQVGTPQQTHEWLLKNNPEYSECFTAVGRNGIALEDVSEHLITPELCSEAINQNPLAIAHIPKSLIESHPEWYTKLAIAAVRLNRYAFTKVPESFAISHPELYTKLATEEINQNPLAIAHIPKSLIESHPELYRQMASNAVERNTFALTKVPESFAISNPKLYTPIVLEAGQKDWGVLQYVPELFITSNLEKYKEMIDAAMPGILKAAEQNRWILRNIPESLIKSHPDQYNEIVNAAMPGMLEALQRNGYQLEMSVFSILLAESHPELYTKLATEAINQNGLAVQHIPKSFRKSHPEMYGAIVKAAMSSILDVIKEHGYVLRGIESLAESHPKLYTQIAIAAVRHYDGMELQCVPRSLAKSHPREYMAIVAAAVRNTLDALQYVPPFLRPLVKSIAECSTDDLSALTRGIHALSSVREPSKNGQRQPLRFAPDDVLEVIASFLFPKFDCRIATHYNSLEKSKKSDAIRLLRSVAPYLPEVLQTFYYDDMLIQYKALLNSTQKLTEDISRNDMIAELERKIRHLQGKVPAYSAIGPHIALKWYLQDMKESRTAAPQQRLDLDQMSTSTDMNPLSSMSQGPTQHSSTSAKIAGAKTANNAHCMRDGKDPNPAELETNVATSGSPAL